MRRNIIGFIEILLLVSVITSLAQAHSTNGRRWAPYDGTFYSWEFDNTSAIRTAQCVPIPIWYHPDQSDIVWVPGIFCEEFIGEPHWGSLPTGTLILFDDSGKIYLTLPSNSPQILEYPRP